jgi:hypothetical protein
LKSFNKAPLRKDFDGVVTAELWHNANDFHTEIIDKARLETRIKCEFLDMPGVYHFLDKDF